MTVPAAAVTVEAKVLVAGFLKMPHAYTFRGSFRGPTLRAPVLSYVVQHPTEGAILIDTGLHPDASTNLRKEYGRLFGLMFGSLAPAAEGFEEQLRAQGVEPREVKTVVMTHLHLDHTGGMRLLPNATFVMDEREWAGAHGRLAGVNGFIAAHLPPLERVRTIDFAGEGRPYGAFSNAVDLLGDGSIRLISTPGHTAGHVSVLLQTADRQVLAVGDAAYTLKSIETQVPPLIMADGKRYRASLAELQAFQTAEPGATLIPTHDPDAWRAL
jgi:glyoxylase-like metal-dependent hydrolase (beta-lactamase superfamily II)